MASEAYLPKDLAGELDRLQEECGEVIEAAARVIKETGKCKRFGPGHCFGGSTNLQMMLTEAHDFDMQMNRVRARDRY